MIERQLDKITNRQKEDRKTIGQNDRKTIGEDRKQRHQESVTPTVIYDDKVDVNWGITRTQNDHGTIRNRICTEKDSENRNISENLPFWDRASLSASL